MNEAARLDRFREMKIRPTFATAIFAVMFLAGCHKQPRPQPLVPPPMLPQSAMLPIPEVLPPGDEPATVEPPAPVPVTTASKPKPRPRNGKKISDLKPGTQPQAPDTQPTLAETPTAPPPKITAPSRDVPTTAAISGGLPHSDEIHHQMTAAQLNQSTEDNLRSITRGLTSAEQSIVAQIRSYMAQSQQAITENDLVRAHNLALKAHLLSDELAHR
jgi:hypothetical protein